MAEKTVLVCDVCGDAAKQSVTIHTGSRRLVKDLCGQHLADLINGARPLKRGRPRASGSAAAAKSARAASAKRSGRAKRSTRKEPSAA
jgi:ribosomal protein L12E/L44/L45/RPP1/RPP2